MRLLDRYVLREALPPFLFGLVLYASLAVVSVTIPRLQWIVGTPVGELLAWLALQLPQALVQTLPIALVLAVLIALGRLASEHELLAMQVGGVPLRRVALTFVAIGAVSAGAVLAMNQWVLPVTNARVAETYWQLTTGRSGLFRLARQNLPIDDFLLHFDATTAGGSGMRGVRIERWDGDVLTLLRAESAAFEGTDLVLKGYRIDRLDLGALDLPVADPELALANLVRLRNVPPDPEQTLVVTTSYTADDLIARFSGGGFEDSRSLTDLRRDANNELVSVDERRQAQVLLQRKLAEPFTNLALLLVAVPLALSYSRSRGVAFGVSLVVTLVWYLFYTFGQLFAQSGAIPVWLGAWGGNALFVVLGLLLFLRRRG